MAIAMSAIFQTILGLIRHPKATAERHIAFKIVVNLALFFMNKIFGSEIPKLPIIAENAKHTTEQAIKDEPQPPTCDVTAVCINGTPCILGFSGVFESKMINADVEHISIVSMQTDKTCIIPCLIGCVVSAVAAEFGALPIPASLERRPLFIPINITLPANPPDIDLKSKASLNISAKTSGIL